MSRTLLLTASALDARENSALGAPSPQLSRRACSLLSPQSVVVVKQSINSTQQSSFSLPSLSLPFPFLLLPAALSVLPPSTQYRPSSHSTPHLPLLLPAILQTSSKPLCNSLLHGAEPAGCTRSFSRRVCRRGSGVEGEGGSRESPRARWRRGGEGLALEGRERWGEEKEGKKEGQEREREERTSISGTIAALGLPFTKTTKRRPG